MKNNILLIVLLLVSFSFYAQTKNSVKVKGKVLEFSNNQPIEFTTIVSIDKNTKKPITASTSQENGEFSFNISNENVYFEISFMGFKTETISTFTKVDNEIDLGNIDLFKRSYYLRSINNE